MESNLIPAKKPFNIYAAQRFWESKAQGCNEHFNLELYEKYQRAIYNRLASDLENKTSK